MNPFKFPFALLMVFGFVMVVPAWMFFVDAHATNLTSEGQFLAQLVLPAALVLAGASWLQPRG